MNPLPIVSVVMPVRNEESHIKKSLSSVMAQDYTADKMEILAADGMSNDRTREIVKLFQERDPRIQLLDNPKKLAASGLNAALRKSKGRIVIRVDGHTEIAPDYVRRAVEHLQKGEADGVGGPIETVGEGFTAQAIAIAMSSAFGVGGSRFRIGISQPTEVDTIAFPAYTREVIEKAGLFDEEMVRNQDDEYNYRLRKMGFKLVLFPDLRSRYYSRGSLSFLWRQYFEYGFWKVRVMQKHPREMRLRQFVPPLFVAVLITSLALSFFMPAASFVFLLTTGSYLAANLGASLALSARKGWQYLFILPFIYAILHFSYGSGFLTGLVRFANHRGKE